MITPPDSTRPVRDAHRFDEEALGAYLAKELGTNPTVTVRQFRGGQSNPTFWVSDGERTFVLRKKPPGKLLPSAHAVEREYRVMNALADTDVPVAKAHLLCEDVALIGTPFFVMDHVVGRVFWNVQLPDCDPGERAAIYEELARVLAALHRVNPDEVGLSNYGRPSGYVARQVQRWTKQYRASETRTIEGMEKLITWLPENLPQDESVAIAHGDFRLDNIIFHPTEARALAVIDWELSTLGHPLADLAYTCMLYDVALPNVGGLLGVDFAATGIPQEQVFVDRYRALSGREEIADWETFKAFSLFRLAAIAQGVFRRSQLGNASSDQASQFGAAVDTLSTIACRLVSLE